MTAMTKEQKLDVFDEYRQQVESKEETPKDDWVPYRFCFRDYVLSIFVIRVRHKLLEVALFDAEDHFALCKDSAVKAGLICLLGDAYLKTGRTELIFRGAQPGATPTLSSGFENQVPQIIRQYATSVGIQLANTDRISSSEGAALLIELAGLSKESNQKLVKAAIDSVHVALQLFRKVWLLEHIELILANSTAPGEIFSGSINFEQRLKALPQLQLLRSAIIEERFFQQLAASNKLEEVSPKVTWNAPWQFSCTLPIRCVFTDHFGRRLSMSAGTSYAVIILAESASGYAQFVRTMQERNKKFVGIMLVVRDIQWMQPDLLQFAETQLRGEKSAIISTVDTLAEIDEEIMTRLAQSASTRRPIQERPG